MCAPSNSLSEGEKATLTKVILYFALSEKALTQRTNCAVIIIINLPTYTVCDFSNKVLIKYICIYNFIKYLLKLIILMNYIIN